MIAESSARWSRARTAMWASKVLWRDRGASSSANPRPSNERNSFIARPVPTLDGVAARRHSRRSVPALRERGGVPARRRRAPVQGLQMDGQPEVRFEVPPELVPPPPAEESEVAY